jgi:sugar phosphate isomerase/epimerase
MKISVIADEVSGDFETALEIIRSWKVDAVEIRRAGERRYPDVSEYWQKRVPQLVSEYGLSVAAISPGLFKRPHPGPAAPFHFHRAQDIEQVEREAADEAELDHELNVVLPASIEAAKVLGTDKIICFSFQRQERGPSPEAVVQVLRHAAEQVSRAGLILAIEVDDIAKRTADLVRRVNHPGLQINWDPANAYRRGEDVPFPDGYASVREFVRHVHFKDARTEPNGNREWALDGVIDWQGQLRALAVDGFDGYISVEPHLRPQVHASLRTLERIRSLVGQPSPTLGEHQLVGSGLRA